MDQLTLSIFLGCNGSYRKTATALNDVFDYATSPGTITALVSSAVKKAQQIHTAEDLSGIKVTANDELFHHNKPIFVQHQHTVTVLLTAVIFFICTGG